MAAAAFISRIPTATFSKSLHVPTAADEWIEAGDLFAGTSNQPVNHRSANAHAQPAKHAKARLPAKPPKIGRPSGRERGVQHAQITEGAVPVNKKTYTQTN